MPQIAGPVVFDLETLGELPDDGFHQTTRGHHPVTEVDAARVRHVVPERGLQIESLVSQVLLQDGADESLVAEKHACDAVQVEIDQGIAFIDIGGDQGDVLDDAVVGRQQHAFESIVRFAFRGAEAEGRLTAKDLAEMRPAEVTYRNGKTVDQMNCVSGSAERVGPMTVELAFDSPQIRRMSDKRRTIPQRRKPGVPVTDKVFPDRFVVAVAQTGANQLQRQHLLIAQRRRKSSSPQTCLHNRFVCRAYLAIHPNDKVLDGHGRLPRSVGSRQTHSTATALPAFLTTQQLSPSKSRTSRQFTNVGSAATQIGMSNIAAAAADLTVIFSDAALTGTNDTVTVNLNAAGDANNAPDLLIRTTGSANGAENLNVVTAGTASVMAKFESTDNNGTGAANSVLKTLTVSGDKDLTVNTAIEFASNTGTVDASTFTGKLKIGLDVGGIVKVIGGKGDDTFAMTTGLTVDDTINGGDGVDTVSVTDMNTFTLANYTKMTNVEIIDQTATNAADLSLVTGGAALTKVVLRENATTIDLAFVILKVMSYRYCVSSGLDSSTIRPTQ